MPTHSSDSSDEKLNSVSVQTKPIELAPLSPGDKLRALLMTGLTSFEIAVATGGTLRAVEARRDKLKKEAITTITRRTTLDKGLDNLYSVVSMLEVRYYVEPENVRAWLIGRSPHLEEQRPASMLRAGKFELVRAAAIAYATGEHPAEFLEQREPLPRVEDPVEV